MLADALHRLFAAIEFEPGPYGYVNVLDRTAAAQALADLAACEGNVQMLEQLLDDVKVLREKVDTLIGLLGE